MLNLWMVCTLDGWVYESSSFFCQWLDPWYCKIDCRLLFTYSTNMLWGLRLFRNLTKFTISWVSCIINSFSIWILNTRIQFFSYVKNKNLTPTLCWCFHLEYVFIEICCPVEMDQNEWKICYLFPLTLKTPHGVISGNVTKPLIYEGVHNFNTALRPVEMGPVQKAPNRIKLEWRETIFFPQYPGKHLVSNGL